MTVTLGQPVPPDLMILDTHLRQIHASGRWSNDGAVVRELERLTAADLGTATVSAVSSGTSALTVALLALDLPRGAEVLTTALTFPATVQAIEAAGLVPVFTAVDPQTLTLDPAAARAAIGPRTAAVMSVHLFGVAADHELDSVCAAAGLPVVHDAAHAWGLAGIAGRGTVTAYSLHATKLLHTGEGGLVATDDTDLAERVRQVRNFGLRSGDTVLPGTNAKLPELSAALGLAVRARLPDEIVARQRVRDGYAAAVQDSDRVWAHAPGRARALVTEVVRCDPAEQQRLLDDLAAVDVVARRFPALCEPGQRYRTTPLRGVDAADLATLARGVVALPIHGRVTPEQVRVIGRVLRG